MPRLFVAIDLPAQLKTALTGFFPELPAARWVSPAELHLTLHFIGDVDKERLSAIRGALSGISFAAFSLVLGGVGHFPPGRRPRVLWVGMDPSQSLMLLHQELELALIEAKVTPDERRFSPHITLARLKETSPAAVESFEIKHHDLASPPFEVREFILYSSILTPHGAIHSKEAAYPCREIPPPGARATAEKT